jgi:hypothetical protein
MTLTSSDIRPIYLFIYFYRPNMGPPSCQPACSSNFRSKETGNLGGGCSTRHVLGRVTIFRLL